LKIITRDGGASSLIKGVYNPRTFILHAASLRQAFAHCAIFPVAAIRRCMGRVSVPLWLTILSDQLPVIALVSPYLTNKLIGRRLLLRRPVTAFSRALRENLQFSNFQFTIKFQFINLQTKIIEN
jgi:hypothetical protein